ncbi:hypothetical protein ISF6_0653 [Piscinibacter sakaiensis]|uniref:Uncharacterized protein n=1 Tax=Piscinibacter sakaiensis TaxID=1547922 RepID=A0A0K8NXI7_PISS1|nr:hypothetical protein ISF6_0653 [Piscinibacter sakaiensis]
MPTADREPGAPRAPPCPGRTMCRTVQKACNLRRTSPSAPASPRCSGDARTH